jgi:hypothetical protein
VSDMTAFSRLEWIGDLREELLEVGVEQARAARENGERRVVTHRAGGLEAFGEGRKDELGFVIVATEGDLGLDGRSGGLGGGGGLGGLAEVDEVGFAPLLVVRIGGELGLHLFVAVELVVHQVEREHATGSEAAGFDDLAGEVVHEAGFGGQDEVAVVENLVASGAETVAVKGGTDGATVGKHDGGGAVPRLHHTGVVTEEGLGLGGEFFVLFPSRRHHEHRGVERIASAEREELEGVVEAGGVGHARLHEGLEVREALAPHAVSGGVFAGAHEVAIAADGVDLAVVRHHAERVREVPRRERVGRVALVEDRERRGELGRLQIDEVFLDLEGREQALVDDRARGERADVEAGDFGFDDLFLGGVLREEELTLELVVSDLVFAGNEGLDDERLGIEGLAT